MRLTWLFLLFFAVCSAFAQDKIYKKDNTVVEAKILEVHPTEIRYKLFTYQDGPLIIISKSEVSSIIYQNGVREVYKQSSNRSARRTAKTGYRSSGHGRI